MREGGGKECLLCAVRLTSSQGVCFKSGGLAALVLPALQFPGCLVWSHGFLKCLGCWLPLSLPASAWGFAAASEGEQCQEALKWKGLPAKGAGLPAASLPPGAGLGLAHFEEKGGTHMQPAES